MFYKHHSSFTVVAMRYGTLYLQILNINSKIMQQSALCTILYITDIVCYFHIPSKYIKSKHEKICESCH